MNMQASDDRLIAAKLTESSCYGLMKSSLIFTARPHCSQCRALYWLDHFCPSVRPSVCHSVTFRYCVHKNEDTIVRFSASGRTIPLVSGEVKFIRIFAGNHPQRER